MVLPLHDAEIISSGIVSSLGAVHMDGRGILQVLLVPFPQGPGCLPYVLFIAHEFHTLVHVNSFTLLSMGSWSLGLTNNCCKALFPLKCVCIQYLLQIFLIISPNP